MRIESNLRGVVLGLIEELQGDDVQKEQVLRTAGHDVLAMVQTRVQQNGMGVDGRLNTKSGKRNGSYSYYYGEKRQKAGRQNAIVDLTFDGDLWRSWQVVRSSSKEVEIGFIDERQGDIASYNEAYFGSIFGLTDDEQNNVIDYLTINLI